MQITLLTLGLVCVAAAIAGGGLKAFNIEIPTLDSLARQLLLGAFGLIVGALGWCCVQGPSAPPPPPEPHGGSTTSEASEPPAGTAQPQPDDNAAEPEPDPRLSLPSASARGSSPPCDQISIEVQLVERSGGSATFRVAVTNGNSQSVALPPRDEVVFVDAAGAQWSQDRFANLSSAWGVNDTVAAGGTFEARLVFEAPRDLPAAGALQVSGLSPDEDPFRDCEVRVGGVRLRAG